MKHNILTFLILQIKWIKKEAGEHFLKRPVISGSLNEEKDIYLTCNKE